MSISAAPPLARASIGVTREATIASMVNLALGTIDKVGAEGEVIVIDDGSSDGSPQVLTELRAETRAGVGEAAPTAALMDYDRDPGCSVG